MGELHFKDEVSTSNAFAYFLSSLLFCLKRDLSGARGVEKRHVTGMNKGRDLF